MKRINTPATGQGEKPDPLTQFFLKGTPVAVLIRI
jgi:hypothetical protein